ncbi:MAG: hypothetical protein AAF682_05365 [Planctomycetota bacterium]
MAEEHEDDDAFGGWLMRALAVLVLICVGLAVAGYFFEGRSVERRDEAHRAEAEEAFSPVLDALRDAEQAARGEEGVVDIDRTVRVLHEIDLALEHADSVEDYVALLGDQDYRGVHPDVLAAREELLDVLLRLYASRGDLADQEATWGFARRWMGLLTFTKVASFQTGFNVTSPVASVRTPSIKLDARSLFDDFEEAEGDRRELVETLRELEHELVEVSTRHSELYWTMLDEWYRLCLHRDRAYLAAYSQDWEEAAASADAAIAMAPHEKEAHLLKALAMIEGGFATDSERDEVGELLADYVRRHPGSSAPALLLQGVNEARRGNGDEARLLFEQASAYYPRQAEALSELLDPYRVRARYLRKSRSGTSIRELYRSTMLGASWFSPELQTAKLEFEAGRFEDGSRLVMDHFARRRAQGEWDLILYDITFCEDLLGEFYPRIFPEDVYLDLEVEPTFFGSNFQLSVQNRSDRALHNATVILCLKFTDMHEGDYETFPSETQPTVPAYSTTDFGEIEIAMELFGDEKDKDDVYSERAILVSNEAVVWVDTIDFKRTRRPSLPKVTPNVLVEKALAALDRDVALEIVSERFFDDDVEVRLPREIAILKPVFRLRHGQETFAPEENVIEGGNIRLRFDAVDEFSGVPDQELVLEADGALVSFALRWEPAEGGGFRFAGLSR